MNREPTKGSLANKGPEAEQGGGVRSEMNTPIRLHDSWVEWNSIQNGIPAGVSWERKSKESCLKTMRGCQKFGENN